MVHAFTIVIMDEDDKESSHQDKALHANDLNFQALLGDPLVAPRLNIGLGEDQDYDQHEHVKDDEDEDVDEDYDQHGHFDENEDA